MIKLLRIFQNVFHFGVVDKPVLLVLAKLREHFDLHLFNLKLVGHEEEKGQRSHFPFLLRIIVFKLLKIGFLFIFLDVVLSQLALHLPDVVKTA
jgi:hypothetical protein